jgi:hypothetical protein
VTPAPRPRAGASDTRENGLPALTARDRAPAHGARCNESDSDVYIRIRSIPDAIPDAIRRPPHFASPVK